MKYIYCVLNKDRTGFGNEKHFLLLLILRSSARVQEINIDPMNMKITSLRDRKRAARRVYRWAEVKSCWVVISSEGTLPSPARTQRIQLLRGKQVRSEGPDAAHIQSHDPLIHSDQFVVIAFKSIIFIFLKGTYDFAFPRSCIISLTAVCTLPPPIPTNPPTQLLSVSLFTLYLRCYEAAVATPSMSLNLRLSCSTTHWMLQSLTFNELFRS